MHVQGQTACHFVLVLGLLYFHISMLTKHHSTLQEVFFVYVALQCILVVTVFVWAKVNATAPFLWCVMCFQLLSTSLNEQLQVEKN